MFLRILMISISLFFIPNIYSQDLPSSSNDTLKIVSWNVHLLPYFFVYPKSKKRTRTQLIAEAFNQDKDYDIIVLQEVFHKTNRRLLKRTIDYILVRRNNSKMKVLRTSKILIGSDWKRSTNPHKKYPESVGLSDHYPMEIQLTW